MTNYLTPNEAAMATRKHPETVTAALRDGSLHGTQAKKNGRWLIREECLDAWISVEPCAHQTLKAAA